MKLDIIGVARPLVSVATREEHRLFSLERKPQVTNLSDGTDEIFRSLFEKADAKRRDANGGDLYGAPNVAPTFRSTRAFRNSNKYIRSIEEEASDRLLLESVADGDKAAMHILFARHRNSMFQFIKRTVRVPKLANDLVSQAFLGAWCAAGRFEKREKVSAWLLLITRVKSVNALAYHARENVLQDNIVRIAGADAKSKAAFRRKDIGDVSRYCADRLSTSHREIINLAYYHKKSVAEVSEIIGVPQATAKNAIFYARKQLARILVSIGLEELKPAKESRSKGCSAHTISVVTSSDIKSPNVLQELSS